MSDGKVFKSPPKLMRSLRKWLSESFQQKFEDQGNSMTHGIQLDYHSCGIIVTNTIAHAIRGIPLWEQQWSNHERIQWFLRLASRAETKGLEQTTPNDTRGPINVPLNDEASFAVAVGDHNFPDLEQYALASNTENTSLQGHGPANAIPRPGLLLTDLLNPTSVVPETDESEREVMSDGISSVSHAEILDTWERDSDVDLGPTPSTPQTESDASSTWQMDIDTGLDSTKDDNNLATSGEASMGDESDMPFVCESFPHILSRLVGSRFVSGSENFKILLWNEILFQMAMKLFCKRGKGSEEDY